jgi:hypothetical protein
MVQREDRDRSRDGEQAADQEIPQPKAAPAALGRRHPGLIQTVNRGCTLGGRGPPRPPDGHVANPFPSVCW